MSDAYLFGAPFPNCSVTRSATMHRPSSSIPTLFTILTFNNSKKLMLCITSTRSSLVSFAHSVHIFLMARTTKLCDLLHTDTTTSRFACVLSFTHFRSFWHVRLVLFRVFYQVV